MKSLSVAGALSLIVASSLAAQVTPDPIAAAADRGRILGAESAKVWMLIVSDFQCPFCKGWHDSTWSVLRRDYVATGKVRVAYVNFPLSIHRNAVPAAVGAMCASAQGKFWEMQDKLFLTQDKWKDLPDPRRTFDSLAASVGTNAGQYKSCVDGKKVNAMVEADYERGRRAGAKSTPTFYIGSHVIEGVAPTAEFRKAIEAALAGK